MSYYEFHVSRRYVQYEGAIKELPRYASTIGKKLLILVASIPEQVEKLISESMNSDCKACMNYEIAKTNSRYAGYFKNADYYDKLREGMEYEFLEIVDSIPSEKNIERVANYVKEKGFDTVVGIGGGRGLDFTRGITHFIPVKVILVPTLAATNASISTLSVIYSDDGSIIQEYWRMNNAPDLTLVDTNIILHNSPQVLASGIADITCTYYEGLCNLELANKKDEFPKLSYEGLLLAINIMKDIAPKAISAIKSKMLTPEFENAVSMIMHNCGPLWSACSIGLAHALDEVFLYFEEAHQLSHGLRVGFATIPMLEYAGKDERIISDYINFCSSIGIPTSLSELGLNRITYDEWTEAAKATIGATHTLEGLSYEVSFDKLLSCLLQYK